MMMGPNIGGGSANTQGEMPIAYNFKKPNNQHQLSSEQGHEEDSVSYTHLTLPTKA